LAGFVAEKPLVALGRQAIVLAGPPGAGKSRIRADILARRGETIDQWRVIDADDSKVRLLDAALIDGSYEQFIKPSEVKRLEARGETFYPLELAALVHKESGRLAYGMRLDAIRKGENVILDTVLSNPLSSQGLLADLVQGGYQVHVVEVEVTEAVSVERIRQRWEREYLRALTGEPDPARPGLPELGGRQVPSSFARHLFAGDHTKSVCYRNAWDMARSPSPDGLYPVTRLDLYDGATGRLDAAWARADPRGALRDITTDVVTAEAHQRRPAEPAPERAAAEPATSLLRSLMGASYPAPAAPEPSTPPTPRAAPASPDRPAGLQR
jgi:predicted kinase